MCFTINVNMVREEMEKRFGAVFSEPRRYEPAYYLNAFALPRIPALPQHDPKNIRMFGWGLIPAWVKDAQAAAKIRTGTFNARAESIHQKPSFREPIRNKRCLLPARGFFEWQDRSGKKIPWYIYLEGHQPFAFAGIYDYWVDPVTGEENPTCSIITTRANPLMEKIHNTKMRMPVILPREKESAWLDDALPLQDAMALLQPFPQEKMQAHTISPLVSRKNADRNVPEVIEPWSYEDKGLFG